MDLIALPYLSTNYEWIFLVLLFVLAYIAYYKYNFYGQFVLILKSTYSQKYTNQYLREETSSSNKLYLLPVFVVVFALFQSSNDLSISRFFNVIFWTGLFIICKYLIISVLAFLFRKSYLFEEIIFQSFLYEKVIGVLLFPVLIVLFYSSIPNHYVLTFIELFILLGLLYKWLRMIYLSFFNTSLSKAHIIIYLCSFEILPLILLTKYLC